MRRRTVPSARGGFSLIEACIAIITVGIGVSALLLSVAAGTRANSAGKQLTQATFLAQEIREWTVRMPFSDPDLADQANPPGPDGSNPQVFVDDLDDLMDVTYSPPRDGQGNPVADMAAWSQALTLTWRDPNSLTTTVAAGTSDVIYVEVKISNRSRQVLTTGWLVTRRE